jgi:hypothetical protein
VKNDYASVQEQSGIRAGDGGFHVTVGGNTDLKGGVISSSATGAASSSLVTATLTQSDIANHATVDASSVGISGGFKVDGDSRNAPKTGTEDGSKSILHLEEPKGATGVNLPSSAAVSSNDSGTTRSGVGAGTLVITDEVAQQALTGQGAVQAAGGVNRNVGTGSDTSGRVINNFDQNATNAALEISSAFNSTVAAPLAAKAANFVGDIGKANEKSAQIQADAYTQRAKDAKEVGNAEAALAYSAKAAEAQATADSWGDNGLNRVALHLAAQGLIGGLAGGNAGAISSIAGVAGGNLGQQLGKTLGEAEADRQGLEGDDRQSLVTTYQETLATIAGAVAGLALSNAAGNRSQNALATVAMSANTADTVDKFNRQLHPKEVQVIQNKSQDFAKLLFATDKPTEQQTAQAQAYLVLAAAADVDVGQQRANSGLNFDQNYIEAKKYLTTLNDTFVNDGGQLQKVFTVKGNEAYDPGKYASYNALQLLLPVMAEGASTGAVRRPETVCDIVCIRQFNGQATPISHHSGDFVKDKLDDLYSNMVAGGWNGVRAVGKGYTTVALGAIGGLDAEVAGGAAMQKVLAMAETAQTGKLVGGVGAVSASNWLKASATGFGLGGVTEFALHPDASPASITTAGGIGAITGPLKLGLNAYSGLANQWIPTSLPNAITAVSSWGAGTTIKYEVNSRAYEPNSSWWTSPLVPCAPIPPRKACK